MVIPVGGLGIYSSVAVSLPQTEAEDWPALMERARESLTDAAVGQKWRGAGKRKWWQRGCCKLSKRPATSLPNASAPQNMSVNKRRHKPRRTGQIQGSLIVQTCRAKSSHRLEARGDGTPGWVDGSRRRRGGCARVSSPRCRDGGAAAAVHGVPSGASCNSAKGRALVAADNSSDKVATPESAASY